MGVPQAPGPRRTAFDRIVEAVKNVTFVARTGEAPVAGSAYVWHRAPDGGATESLPARVPAGTPAGGCGAAAAVWIYTRSPDLMTETACAASTLIMTFGERIGMRRVRTGAQVRCNAEGLNWGLKNFCRASVEVQRTKCEVRRRRRYFALRPSTFATVPRPGSA